MASPIRSTTCGLVYAWPSDIDFCEKLQHIDWLFMCHIVYWKHWKQILALFIISFSFVLFSKVVDRFSVKRCTHTVFAVYFIAVNQSEFGRGTIYSYTSGDVTTCLSLLESCYLIIQERKCKYIRDPGAFAHALLNLHETGPRTVHYLSF